MDIASARATAEPTEGAARLVEETLRSVQQSASDVCDAVETPVLQDLSPTNQDIACLDPRVATTNAVDAIKIRHAVLKPDTCEDGNQIAHVKIQFKGDAAGLQLGTLENRPVMLEILSFNPDPETGELYPQTLCQLRKMSGLLSKANDAVSFHIMPCLGFFLDKAKHNLGLVFETLPHFKPGCGLTTLLQLYSEHRIMPLGHRFHLGHALAEAVEHFHRVGWVHKGLRSNTIAFNLFSSPNTSPTTGVTEILPTTGLLKDPSSRLGEFDLARPYLFGFEYARAGEDKTLLEEDHSLDNNLYRHPDRWGRPKARYEKMHDVYVLGIVLLEVAYWKDIRSILKLKLDRLNARVVPTELRDEILKKCQQELPFRTGEVLAQIIRTCITFGDSTGHMSEYEAQAFFQRHVISRIRGAVGKV